MDCKSCQAKLDMRSAVQCSKCEGKMHSDCVIRYGGAVLCDICFSVEQEEPESKFGDFVMPEFIRRTHIETYRTCPYKFYLEVLKDNPMPPNCYTQVGSDLHELFEEVLETRMPATPEGALQKYEEEYWRHYTSELFELRPREDMWQRAVDSIATFYDTIPDIKDIVAIEETIFFNIGDNIPDVRITMDVVTEVDGELEMHDWKTGRVMVGKKLSTDLQAPLYIYAVKERFGKPVRSFTFHYLQENKTRTYHRLEDDPDTYVCRVGRREYFINLTDAIREVKRLFSRIKKGDFNVPTDTRSMYFSCKMCHLRREGLCAGADEQSWKQLVR